MKLNVGKLIAHALAAFIAVFSGTYVTTHNISASVFAGVIAFVKDIIAFVQNPLTPSN